MLYFFLFESEICVTFQVLFAPVFIFVCCVSFVQSPLRFNLASVHRSAHGQKYLADARFGVGTTFFMISPAV